MNTDILVTGANGFIGSHLAIGKPFMGRVENLEQIEAQIKGMKGIVHLAAKSDWRAVEGEPLQALLANLVGLVNVLDCALMNNVWVLFISTFQVRDRTVYGLSKLMGEELCRLYQKMGLHIKILRLPVVYGPGSRDAKIVARFIKELQSGENPKIKTDDKFYFAYVDDVAKMIENEVELMNFRPGKKIKLTTLAKGIKKCLSEKAITQ